MTVIIPNKNSPEYKQGRKDERKEMIEYEIEFLQDLLGNAKYENAVLTREDIIKRIKQLSQFGDK